VKPPTPSDKEQAMTDAFTEAVKEAIAAHHKAGRSVPVRVNGKLTWIGPSMNENEFIVSVQKHLEAMDELSKKKNESFDSILKSFDSVVRSFYKILACVPVAFVLGLCWGYAIWGKK
jgi:hypothetical protein